MRPQGNRMGLCEPAGSLLPMVSKPFTSLNEKGKVIVDGLMGQDIDDLNRALDASSVTSSLMFGLVMGMLFRNPIAESHRADFENILCLKWEARRYVIKQLEARKVNALVEFPDGSPSLDIKKELFLTDPDGLCPGMQEMTRELDECLRQNYAAKSEWFPRTSSIYVDPFCPDSGHMFATKEWLRENVDQSAFRVWAHNKYHGEDFPYDERTLNSGILASATLALTLFGCLMFYVATTISGAREDQTGRALRRFSKLAVPAIMLLFISLGVGVYFAINFLLHVMELRVSTVLVSYHMEKIFAYTLSIGSTILLVWASAAFLYSYEWRKTENKLNDE